MCFYGVVVICMDSLVVCFFVLFGLFYCGVKEVFVVEVEFFCYLLVIFYDFEV